MVTTHLNQKENTLQQIETLLGMSVGGGKMTESMMVSMPLEDILTLIHFIPKKERCHFFHFLDKIEPIMDKILTIYSQEIMNLSSIEELRFCYNEWRQLCSSFSELLKQHQHVHPTLVDTLLEKNNQTVEFLGSRIYNIEKELRYGADFYRNI